MSNTSQILSIARSIALQTNRNPNAYKPTMLVSTTAAMHTLRAGQWVITDMGQRGQYLGTTSRGTVVIRWQQSETFKKVDAKANRPLRQFAKVYGSK